MILVDTPIWIDHLAMANPALTDRLRFGAVRMHPFVIGEILLGKLRDPVGVRQTLGFLRSLTPASPDDVLAAIRRHDLAGSGIGYVDACLVTAVLLTPPCKLWTRDRRLAAVAARLGIAAGVT